MAEEIIVKNGESVEKHGPYGDNNKDGQGQRQWCMMLDSCELFETISEVIVKSGSIIDSIAFTTVKPTPCGCGATATHRKFGGNGGSQLHKITLKCGEYITHISGAIGNWKNERFVAKLTIHTNLCPNGYGPYGHGIGVSNISDFSTPIPSGGYVVGFFGTHNDYLQSIGVYGKKKLSFEKDGPYGSQQAQTWDMKLDESLIIKEIIIKHGYVIDAIGFMVGKSCGNVSTNIIGGEGGKTSKITLQYGEYITHISGMYGDYGGYKCIIAMLKIHTNLHPKGYGPYGSAHDVENVGIFLSSPPSPCNCHIVGFYGRHGKYLESIGTYYHKKRRKGFGISETCNMEIEGEWSFSNSLSKVKVEQNNNETQLNELEASIIRSSALKL